MLKSDTGELKKEIIHNRELIRELMSKIENLSMDVDCGENAVILVPQGSQPPQPKILTVELVKDIGRHKKRISTYYARCFKKGSQFNTLNTNCQKVLESIEFVLKYTTEKADINNLNSKKDAVSKQLQYIRKDSTNVLLRRV